MNQVVDTKFITPPGDDVSLTSKFVRSFPKMEQKS